MVVEGLGLAAQDDGLDELVAIAGEGHPLHHWGDAQGFGFGRNVQKLKKKNKTIYSYI